MEDNKRSRILDYLIRNVNVIGELVQECNSWNSSLEDYWYYENGEEFFNTYFYDKPQEVARAVCYGKYNYMDDYVKFNAYGNLESCSEWEYECELQNNVEEILDVWYELYLHDDINCYDSGLKELLED